MKLIKINHKGENLFLPNCYPSEIKKDGKLEFFIQGQGWQKAKKYEIVEGVELPERWDKNLTWLDVAKLYDQYGLEVANVYADCKTAGIISRQTTVGYGRIYSKIKHLIDDTFDPKFFELLKCDYTMSCFGFFLLDIVELDKKFEQMDVEYNSIAAMYKGKECSMSNYVLQKYGQKYVDIIEAANKN